MKRKFILTSIMLLVFTTGFSQNFASLKKSFYEYYEADEYEKALALVDQLVPAAEEKLDDDPEALAELAYNIGEMYFLVADYENAMMYWGGAVENYRTVSESDFTFGYYGFSYARALHTLGMYVDAGPWYEATLGYLAEGYGQYSLDYANCFRFYAELKLDMAKYEEAKPLVEAVVFFYQEITGTESFEYWDARTLLAMLYQQSGAYDLALTEFEIILEWSQENAEPINYAITLNNVAELYRELGRYDEAVPMYNEALQFLDEKEYPLDVATTYNNLALALAAQGKYTESEAAYLMALNLYLENNMKEHVDASNTMNNLADLYKNMGRYYEAAELLVDVIDIRYKVLGEEHPSYAHALTNMGLVYYELGMYPDAEEFLLTALEIYRNVYDGRHRFVANAHHNLAVVYSAVALYDEAVGHFDTTLTIMADVLGTDHPLYATYLSGSGALHAYVGQYEAALEQMQQALDLLLEHYGEENIEVIDASYNIGVIYLKMGNYEEAKARMQKAVSSYDKLLKDWFPSLSENEQMQFYYTLSWRYDFLNGLLINSGNQNENAVTLLENSLATKGLLLNYSVAARQQIMNNGNEAVIELYNEWQDERQQLVQKYRLTEAELEETGIDLRKAEQHLNALEKELSVMSSAFSEGQTEVSYNDITNALKPGEALVNIMRVWLDTSIWQDSIAYLAIVVKANAESPVTVRLDTPGLMETLFLEDYLNKIHHLEQDYTSYNRFWQAIEPELEGVSRVYFAPDGVYHKLNPNTLYDSVANEYLVQRYTISTITSPRDVVFNNTGSAGQLTASLYGYPEYDFVPEGQELAVNTRSNSIGYTTLSKLPGTKTEVELIEETLKQYGWEVNSYLGKHATETQLKTEAAPRVLHIATHGFFLPEMDVSADMIFGIRADRSWSNPLLRSGLMMTSATRNIISNQLDDGILTAYEASSMNLLNTELVVLSACETGLGESRDEQGVYGLQRAFLMAGAQNLVMSLWQVADQPTQELMTLFYEQLGEGESIETAFRNAQLTLMKTYPEPFFWGAFVHVTR